MSPALGFAIGLALVMWAHAGRADLPSDADDLARAWTDGGHRATRLPPLFLDHARPRAVRLPEGASTAPQGSCTTVAFLTGRSADFVAKIEPIVPAKGRPHGGRIERSVAGGVLLSECGKDREALERLTVELRVGRAAMEIVMATGDTPSPPIAEALPERASGPLAPPADPGPRPQLEPVAVRGGRAEQRARDAGAADVRPQTLTADGEGTGRELLRLEEGCHRVELFSDLSGKRPVDVDAELRETASERLLVRDRSEAPDARLDLCAGTTMGVGLLFAGAPGPVHVLLLDEVFPLPRGLPVMWGARARAGLGAALWRRKAPAVETDPIEQKLGVSGVTTFPIFVEPGRCYLAAVAVTRGDTRAITLSATSGLCTSFDSSAGLTDNAAVAFCAGSEDQAHLEVEARGGNAAWVLDVWRMGMRAEGEVP